MDKEKEQPRLLRRIMGIPGRGLRWLGHARRRLMIGLRNSLRRMRRAHAGYVVLRVGGSLPERAAPPRPFLQRFLPLPIPEPPLSLQTLNARLRRIADAPNVHGVVFIFTGLNAGVASLQNLRRSIERLRAAGKEAIVVTPYLDIVHYYVASAASRIIVPPTTEFTVLGMRTEATFFKDALQHLGIKVDVFQISPYKTSYNRFSESEITAEQRQQLEWLLEDTYDQLTAAMAAGRHMEQAALQGLIDHAPFPAAEAKAHGLIDAIAYEDELPRLLASDEQEEAKLHTWPQARRLLLEKSYPLDRRFIGVISLEGTITPGSSRQSPIDLPIPFVSGAMAGDETLRQLLRRAERQLPQMAALILHVDSPGGVALSADLIWRDVQRLARKIPVLVYMGNAAASGGYYVSAPARHIMSQTGTITGSIGVLSGRINTDGLYEKIEVNRTFITRGAHAHLYSDSGELTAEERQLLWNSIVHAYEQFKQVVASGRNLPVEELDPICEGRVWTGRQAQALKLVDSHGDFVDAIQKAVELAELPAGVDVPIYNFYPGGGSYLLPRPFPSAQELLPLLLGEQLRALSGRPLLLLPFDLHRFGS